jgi:hypothetical protein
MHFKCCSIAARAEIKVVELRVAHPRALESLKEVQEMSKFCIFLCQGVKNTARKFLDHLKMHEHHLART